MTLRLPANSAVDVPYEDGEKDRDCSDSGSDSDGAEDNKELEGWDDWVEEERPCKSLFDDKVLDSATSAVKYDGETHGFDVLDVCAKFSEYSFAYLPFVSPDIVVARFRLSSENQTHQLYPSRGEVSYCRLHTCGVTRGTKIICFLVEHHSRCSFHHERPRRILGG